MKKISLAIALSLLLLTLPRMSVQAQQTITQGQFCNKKQIYDASTNGSTLLITGGAGGIYVCGYTIWAGGTAAVKFISGTGTTCGTGSVNLTPAFALTTQTGVREDSPNFRGFSVPGGVDVCINTSAGVAVQAIIYYAQ